jgi:HK97 family phage major capsid protein
MAHTALTTNSAYPWRPDLTTFAPQDVLPRAAIFYASTVSGRIEGDQPSLRVAYIVDDDAEFVAEGDEIPEGDPALNEAEIFTRKFAQLVRLSREQYSQVSTPDQLAASVARAMTIKADQAFLTQTVPTSPAVAPVAGLTNTSGLVTKSGVSTSLDALIDLEAALRANLAMPALWVLAPTTWAALRKLKIGSSYNSTLLGAGTDDADPRLLSMPVLVNNQMPSLTGLLVDPTAVVSAVSDLTIAVSDQSYFSSDSYGIRATMRTGHVVPRPNRIGLFALPSAWTVTLGSPSAVFTRMRIYFGTG